MYFKIINLGIQSESKFLGHPKICPNCHKTIYPEWVSCYHPVINGERVAFVLLSCPNTECKVGFLAKYTTANHGHVFNFVELPKFNMIKKGFSESIDDTSLSFVEIYNQAYYAEQIGLFEISGVGYRKALEFLIKDYLIEKDPENSDKIKNLLLGKCINDHITNEYIKAAAKRAVWLGNDETHYVRKWEEKTIEDLKILTELTVHWIEMEKLTARTRIDMPDGGRR